MIIYKKCERLTLVSPNLSFFHIYLLHLLVAPSSRHPGFIRYGPQQLLCSDSQPWLHIRILWEPFKNSLSPDRTQSS